MIFHENHYKDSYEYSNIKSRLIKMLLDRVINQDNLFRNVNFEKIHKDVCKRKNN